MTVTLDEAIKWLQREISYLKAAPHLNFSINPEWEFQKRIFEMALAALQNEQERKSDGSKDY